MERQYRILCVGVNKVAETGFNELKYAEKNAAAAAAYFKNLNSDSVTLLTGKETTKSRILGWIKKCNAELEKDLTIILFFSGHASAEKNRTNRELERCLWINGADHTGLEAHKLKTNEILNASDNPDHRLILVVDACYHLAWKPSVETVFEEFRKSERITSLKSYSVISSSAVGQSLFEDPAMKLGVFTHYFLKTLSGRYILFLKRKIDFFKLLQLLDKKVRNHRFTTDTGRKVFRPILKENGIISHFSGKNFKLPVLEPIPLTTAPDDHFLLQKTVQLFHYFTCTRLRRKACLTGIILGIFILLFYFLSSSIAVIHFVPPRHAVLQYNLPARQEFPLEKLETQHVGKSYYREVFYYFFKSNWENALRDKLDGNGKIILIGNLLGLRLDRIEESRKLEFAIDNPGDVFYWDPEDVMEVLKNIRREFSDFNKNRKKKALQLLAILGKHGESSARSVFSYQKESDQELRNLFLSHFYSPDFVEKNLDFLNIKDYLYLKRNQKRIPPKVDLKMRRDIEIYLKTMAAGIPDSPLDITDETKMSEIYKKLGILAVYESPYFREKASVIIDQAFFPHKVFGLFWDSRNLQNKLWLLELYMKRVRHVDDPFLVWDHFVSRYIPNLAGKEEKGAVLKIILDTNLELIPRKYWNNLLHYLRYIDPKSVTVADWENWIKRYSLAPKDVFYWIIDKDYKAVYPFLQKRYEYFKGLYNGGVFDRLYETDKSKALDLAKEIYKIGIEKDRLHAAVFLYTKNHPEYASFIAEFLERAEDNPRYRHLLGEFYGDMNKAVIQLIAGNKQLEKKIKSLLNHPQLFYRLFKLSMELWPQETIQRVLTSQIPREYNDGYLFLRRCEQLPDEYREKMLVKMFNADIEPSFKTRVESSLARFCPRRFLGFVFHKKGYQWNLYTRGNVVRAYQAIPVPELYEELVLNLREEAYLKVRFICEALSNKKDDQLNIAEIRSVLSAYDRPLERISLRELRYYVNKRRFLEVK